MKSVLMTALGLLLFQPGAMACNEYLEVTQFYRFDLASWKWETRGIQSRADSKVRPGQAVPTAEGLTWLSDSRAATSNPGSWPDLFSELAIAGSEPRGVTLRRTWGAYQAYAHDLPFAWGQLARGVFPELVEKGQPPTEVPVERRQKTSWDYNEGRLEIEAVGDALVLTQKTLAPPVDAQFIGQLGNDSFAFRDIQGLRIEKLSGGIVATQSNAYAVSGLLQLATLAKPVLEATARSDERPSDLATAFFTDPRGMLLEANARWRQIRERVKGLDVISVVHVRDRLVSGEPFMTHFVYGPSRVIRRDHFLESVGPDGDLGPIVGTFRVKMTEMALDAKTQELTLVAQTEDAAVLFLYDSQGGRRTEVSRPETRIKIPNRRYGQGVYPPSNPAVEDYYDFSSERRRAVARLPDVSNAYSRTLDAWLREAVILEVLASQGRGALPRLDFIHP